jgi:ABC-type dipeptide/oligopeptide/nickel transport system permease component
MREIWHRQRWWVARLAMLPVHIFFFSIVVFFLVRSIPGNPVLAMTGGQVTHAMYLKLQRSLGLDGSEFQQLRTFLWHTVRLHLGDSIVSGRPVTSDVKLLLPDTLELAILGLAVAVVIALTGAYLVVLHPRNPASRLLSGYSRAAAAVPDFCLGVAGIFIFYATLHWAPAPLGLVSSNLTTPKRLSGFPLLDALLRGQGTVFLSIVEHLILPVAVLSLANAPILMKLLIRSLQEAVDAPPTRFRIATGASRATVVISMYRRALPAAVTMLGTMFGYLLGGAVVLEALFGFSGMGQYAVNAVNSKDFVALQGFLLVVGSLSLLVFFLVDLANMFLDPRRRAGVRQEVAV